MCSKKIEKEILDLHELVSNLNAHEGTDDGYIEIIEATTPIHTTPKPSKPRSLKPALTPPTKPQNVFQRTFAFTGETKRGYYFWNTLCLFILSIVVVALVGEGVLDDGWGILVLALAAWSLLATTVKRWRDTGYSMWWLITLLVPVLVVFFSPSKHDP